MKVTSSGRSRISTGITDLLGDRMVSSGSVFSTILISTVIGEVAPDEEVDQLVDVGSGDSPYRHLIAHRRYLGVDRRPRGRDAHVVIGDAEALPVASCTADALLCTEVIEHVSDERALASELARVAVPGAPLLLSAPFVHGLHEKPYDFRRLTSIGLTTTLEGAGWRVDEFASIGGPFVVSLDSLVRWMDANWRRLVRTVIPKRGNSWLLTTPSASLQRVLARAVLACSRHLGRMDPMDSLPRLTLGYVVLARRLGGRA